MKKEINMQKPYLMMLTILCVALSLAAAEQKANFSGTWILNNEKSQLGEGGGWMLTTKITAKQDESAISIDRSITRRSGEESIFSENIGLNGKESQNNMEGRQKTSVATWSEDKTTLTISSKTVFEREGTKMEITSVEIWKMLEGGKVLSIDYTSQSPRGERKATYIYDKQK
jgi:hypothetical protein